MNIGYTATYNNDIAINPRNQDQVVWGSTDYTVLHSENGIGRNGVSQDIPKGWASKGYSIAVDATTNPTTFFASMGNRDSNIQGNVWYTNDLSSAASWRNITSYAVATNAARPVGVCL